MISAQLSTIEAQFIPCGLMRVPISVGSLYSNRAKTNSQSFIRDYSLYTASNVVKLDPVKDESDENTVNQFTARNDYHYSSYD